MAQEHQPGTVYWIDHFVVGTNDLNPWIQFTVDVLGAKPEPIYGLTTIARQQRHPIFCFSHLRHCHTGAFLQNDTLPAGPGLGTGLPRYGFYVRPEDIDEHLKRLDAHDVPHTDPRRTSQEGDEGTAIYFEDPAGNQVEFWAPARMPGGAMAEAGPLKVGRISHAVLESRDLDRTAEFFTRFCNLDLASTSDVPKDTLAFRLAGGGRLVFKLVEELDARNNAAARRNGLHTALTVHYDDFFPSYRRLWDALPEWDFDSRSGGTAEAELGTLPARTALHGSAAGRQWKQLYGRGDDFYDWDTNTYHLVGGVPVDGSLVIYEPRYMEDYLEDAHKTGQGSGLRPTALSVGTKQA